MTDAEKRVVSLERDLCEINKERDRLLRENATLANEIQNLRGMSLSPEQWFVGMCPPIPLWWGMDSLRSLKEEARFWGWIEHFVEGCLKRFPKKEDVPEETTPDGASIV